MKTTDFVIETVLSTHLNVAYVNEEDQKNSEVA